ncbi:hypothetical protein DICA3_E05402 [Diutina catenulata]
MMLTTTKYSPVWYLAQIPLTIGLVWLFYRVVFDSLTPWWAHAVAVAVVWKMAEPVTVSICMQIWGQEWLDEYYYHKNCPDRNDESVDDIRRINRVATELCEIAETYKKGVIDEEEIKRRFGEYMCEYGMLRKT